MFKKNNEKGFTLIELMIVIAIIGILAAVAVPNFISYRNKAYCSSVESDAHNILAAVASYFALASRTTLPKITDLKATEGLVLSGDSTVGDTDVKGSTDSKGKIWVEVTKGKNNNCPHGSIFTAYIGGEADDGGWK